MTELRVLPTDDLAVSEGCYFDAEAAEKVRDFFRRFLRHSKGAWAGQPFELLDWQWRDVIQPLFGWKRADGTRRFRKGYIEVAKKNGKTTLASGIGLYLLIADGESGAEVYSAGADREQAGIVFREAASMVGKSPALSDHVQVIESTKRLVFPRTGSFYKALCRESGTNEGLNIHGLIFEELHAQKNRDLFDTLTYGGASRRQPLQLAITTAGWDRHSICWEQHEYAWQVIEGVLPDWSFFPYIAAAGEEDDWEDPATWAKANPSIGVTVKLDEMREAYEAAKASPRKENSFKRYRLNIWTEQELRWLQMEDWDACGERFEASELAGLPCYAGLDLATVKDLAAFVLFFPDAGNAVLPFFFCPQEGARERARADKVPYPTWARQGLIELTEGNVTDYRRILQRIGELGETYNIREIAVDRWNSQQLQTDLTDAGFDVIQFGQGMASMTSPTKELEKLVLEGNIRHGGHPVLRWNAANVSVTEDPAGNIKPDKKKSSEKIDGIVALIMAIGRAIVQEQPRGSVYEERGLVTI